MCQNKTIQEYDAPDNSIDFMLLSNCLYYAMDDLEKHLSRCMRWLSPEGVAVVTIIHERESNFIGELRELTTYRTIFTQSVKYVKWESIYQLIILIDFENLLL